MICQSCGADIVLRYPAGDPENGPARPECLKCGWSTDDYEVVPDDIIDEMLGGICIYTSRTCICDDDCPSRPCEEDTHGRG